MPLDPNAYAADMLDYYECRMDSATEQSGEAYAREYDEQGFLIYSFAETVAAMHPYYVMRAAGGAMYLTGMLIMAWNVTMTIWGFQREEQPLPGSVPALQPAQ